jgi:hypothetical protein
MARHLPGWLSSQWAAHRARERRLPGTAGGSHIMV